MSLTSRYADLAEVPAGPLNDRPELAPRDLLDAEAVELSGATWDHVVTQGERMDMLAFSHLGDSRLWWMIADMNLDVDPLRLRGGQRLLMPMVDALR